VQADLVGALFFFPPPSANLSASAIFLTTGITLAIAGPRMSVTLLLGMLLCILLPGGPLGVHGVTEIVATGELIQDRAASFGPWLDGSGVTGGLVPLLAFANEGYAVLPLSLEKKKN